MKDPILKEALEKWEYLSMSPEELYEYRGRMKRLRDERALIEDSMIAGREEGFKQGHQEGFEKGREEGKEEGIEKGTELAKREFVKKLIENGFKNEQIVQLVDVSLEQVELIRREQL